MALRLLLALALGALIGLERELVGKYEAGIRTTMLVCGGAAIFSMIALALPYVVSTSQTNLPDVVALNSGFAVIANIVVGIGFLGAGIILKTGERVHGLTTAADVWLASAVGALIGIGLLKFGAFAAIIIAGLLYFLRKIGLYEHVRQNNGNGG